MGLILDNIAVEQEYHKYVLMKMDKKIVFKEHPMCVCDWCFASLSTTFHSYHGGGCLLIETR